MTDDILQDALLFAAARHHGQWRDGDAPIPYILHPIHVMETLRDIGGISDAEMLSAALLHDLLEETATTFAELNARFGNGVADLVQEVTRDEPTLEEKAGLNPQQVWEMRTKLLLDEIRLLSTNAMALKLADRLENLRDSARTRGPKKHKRYLMQTRLILDIIPSEVNPPLWNDIQNELTKNTGR